MGKTVSHLAHELRSVVKVEPAEHLRHFRSKVLHVSQFGRDEQAVCETDERHETVAVGGRKAWGVTVLALRAGVLIAVATVFALDTACVLEVIPHPALSALVVAVTATWDGGAGLALVVLEDEANVTPLAG